MALGFNRRRIFVKGLGTFQVREIDPTPATAFSSVGFTKMVTLSQNATIVEDVADNGAMIDASTQSIKYGGVAQLMQSSKDEIDLVRTNAAKLYAIRYHGLAGTGFWQMFLFPVCRILPSLELPYRPGERLIGLPFTSLNQTELSYDVPEMTMAERTSEMTLDDVDLWVDPRELLNVSTNRILDISGYERHGQISSDYLSVWNTSGSAVFLRFDGVNDSVDFGDVLDDDGTTDFLISMWIRVPAADGTQQEIMSKKALVSGNTVGIGIYRNTSNKIAFCIGTGAANVEVTTSTSLLQNVWKQYVVTVDRNGNAVPYLNGVADGTPASVAAMGSAANALSLYVGRDGTNFGQFDKGGFRIRRFSSGLPATIASQIASDYNAEKAYYGL